MEGCGLDGQRFVLRTTPQQWERIAAALPGKVGDPGAPASGNRLFVEAELWIARTGAPWRDLPDEFGIWYSVSTRFWRWAHKGVPERLFQTLSDDPDFEYVPIVAARASGQWRHSSRHSPAPGDHPPRRA
jgi:putative transposase